MVLKAALSLRYRRRSPDALANVILGLLLVAVCLVSWELVVPASAPSLGAAPAGGRLLLQAPPVSSSSNSGAFQPPPPPAPKQPKQFNGLDKARARACGRSRAAMSPWPQGLSGTHFLPPARNPAAACTSCAATATPARTPACFAEPAAHDGAETNTKESLFLRRTQFLVIFYIGGVLYCLLGFAVVCEEYFVASLLILGEKFHLSDDVNGETTHTRAPRSPHDCDTRLVADSTRNCTPPGATLMAAGSSMPEVFSSFVALANPNTDNSLGMVRLTFLMPPLLCGSHSLSRVRTGDGGRQLGVQHSCHYWLVRYCREGHLA